MADLSNIEAWLQREDDELLYESEPEETEECLCTIPFSREAFNAVLQEFDVWLVGYMQELVQERRR